MTTAKLQQLRSLFSEHQLQAYVIPTEDAHQSEYIGDSDKRRQWISGFTGSAGLALVTTSDALLWTDGRYYLQASQQLDSNWKLMKAGLPETPTVENWIAANLAEKSRIGVDPALFSKLTASRYIHALTPKKQELVSITNNLVDAVWTGKPASSQAVAFTQPLQYSGVTHQEKIAQLRKTLASKSADAIAVAALDEVAWLFNIRGSDVTFNPVVYSYALVTADKVVLYIDSKKVTEEVRKHLGSWVEIQPYNGIFEDLKQLSSQKKKVLMDQSKCSLALYNCVDPSLIVEDWSPITYAKAIKNPVELQCLKDSHIRDAAALIKFFKWLEDKLNAGATDLTEASVSDRLAQFRSEQKDFVSLSFDTIAGSGSNGAIIHYKPEHESCASVTKDKLFLCDSGGQYRDGTTDVTRTVHFGTPTDRERTAFTRVLQGHVALGCAVFPHGTLGNQLDILARLPLWSIGLDYRHGTGHGVGSFLNVHEGPQGISFREPPWKVPLVPGMTVTDEPGYYEDGRFGVRIENVLIVKEAKTPDTFGDKKYYCFEHITLVPYQTKLIDCNLLTKFEMDFVDAYHKQCLEKVGPLLSGADLEWLKRETQPLKRPSH